MKNPALFALRTLAKGKVAGVIVALLVAFYLGSRLAGSPAPIPSSGAGPAEMHDHVGESAAEATTWTCVMHPQIRLSEPGACPLCRMDLVPVTTSTGDDNERLLVMSQADKKLAEIQTSLVERKFVNTRIRMVGMVDYDETRVKIISTYMPGRIDRLYVDYTGIEVREGDHLALIYSPDLLTAQEELLEAKRRVDTTAQQRSEFLRQSDARALESAREKLRLYGLSDAQIKEIETRGTGENHILITSPQSGVVIEKSVNEGQYVQTGSQIYTVADLDYLWVKLDAYEQDLTWLHYGQHVDLQTEAYPGEHFEGIIAFIAPTVDARTRTVKLRVNVDNEDGRLKPGMFVRATVHARVAKGGKVMDPGLAGKWIGPMHPEIVRDEPGDCPICEMPLVRAEDLGYVSPDDDDARPLVVPVTAVLRTGKRAVVYVEKPDAERPTYEGREIVLGPRTGDYYLVRQGLSEGERVVTNGNFNIDSALQIRAMPSMMSMEGESPDEGGDIPTFRIALTPIYERYLIAQSHLATDQFAAAQEAFMHLEHLVDGVDMTLVEGDAHDAWMSANRQLKNAAQQMQEATNLEAARRAFELSSKAVIALEKRFGHIGEKTFVEIFCPMAFDRGAAWLQISTDIRNPYYGEKMIDCGNVTSEYAPKKASRTTGPSGHQH